MAASYWARWTSRQTASDLRDRLLPLATAEGYDLLTWQQDWQMFDRGGVMRKLAWSLNGGGRWSDSPTGLTVSYATVPEGTIVTFHWHLAIKPLPVSPEQKTSFEHWVRSQMNRIVEGLRKPLQDPVGEQTIAPAAESLVHSEQLRVTDDAVGAHRTATTPAVRIAARPTVHYATACFTGAPECRNCHHTALPVPGAAGRYYCLNCRQLISRQPIA